MSDNIEVYQLKGMGRRKRRVWEKTEGYSLRGRPRKRPESKERDKKMKENP